jgi:hypothetical protein
MQTIRFPTEGNRFEDYRDAGHLFRVPFEVVQPNGHTRLPRPPMITLADLDRWMRENGYAIANQRPDFSSQRFKLHHIVADVVKDGDLSAQARPRPRRREPQPVAVSATTPLGEPQQSVHLALWEAYGMKDMLSFVLRPDPSWTLKVAFSRHDTAQHFGRCQARRRGVKVKLEILESDCDSTPEARRAGVGLFVVHVPVHPPHQPHPNACLRWSVAGLSEAQFAQVLATAGLTSI